MSMSSVDEARDRRDAARSQVMDTLGELRARAAPKAMARDIGQRSVAVATRNQATIAAAGVAVALFLARHRIAALFTGKRRRK